MQAAAEMAKLKGDTAIVTAAKDAYEVGMDEDFITALEYGMPPTAGMVRDWESVKFPFTGIWGAETYLICCTCQQNYKSSQFASKPGFSVVGFLVIGLLTSAENVNLSGNWYRSIGYAIDQ